MIVGAGLVGCGGARPALAPPSSETCANDPALASFALTLADVTVHVTKNGGVWELAPNLQLVAADEHFGEEEARPFWSAASAGDGTYTVTVPTGLYDVRMNGGQGLVGTLAAGVRIDGPSSLMYDLETVMVTGTVRFRGGPFPAERGGAGLLCLVGPGYLCTELAGEASFAHEVIRGASYDLTWSRGGEVTSTDPMGVVPYGSQEFGTRTFDRDTTLELDVDAPSVVVQGQVSVDGAGIALPVQLFIGSLIVTFADDSGAGFSVRLLSGRYTPTFYLPTATSGFVYGVWSGCPADGCLVTADAEWRIDVPSASPRATVSGTIDFVAAPGALRTVPAGQNLGTVTLRPATSSVGVHGAGSHLAHVDRSARFQLVDVPYGIYTVRFQGLPLDSTPAGLHDFEGTLIVDRAEVAWSGSVPLVPVMVDVRVNGQSMASDSMLDGEPRGILVFSRPGDQPLDGRYTLDLGETGPARFERSMVPGRYQVAIHSTTTLGRTYLRGYKQDALPVGESELGAVDVAAVSEAAAPVQLAFDLSVKTARIQIDGADRVAPTVSPFTMLRLVSGAGSRSWAELPNDGGPVSVRLYGGCYGADVYGSDAPAYPYLSPPSQMARVGTYCTCDARP